MISLIKQIRTTPRAAATEFCSFVAADCDSEATVKTYRQRLRGFISFLETSGVSNVRAMKPGHVDKWVSEMKRQTVRYVHGSSDRPPEKGRLSKATIAGRLQAVKRFCAWCQERYQLDTSPAEHLTVRRPPPRPADQAMRFDELLRLIRFSQAQALYTKSPEAIRYMALLAFLIETMARRGEVASLRISALDLDNPQSVKVTRGTQLVSFEGYTANVEGKSGPRRLWFSEWTAEPLRAYLAVRPEPRHEPTHDMVWVGFSDRSFGRPLTPAGIYQVHKSVTKAIKLKGPSGLHAIRHCMATFWAKHTSLDQLQKKLGHASITTTMGYVATDDSDVIAATDELSPLKYTDGDLATIMGDAATV